MKQEHTQELKEGRNSFPASVPPRTATKAERQSMIAQLAAELAQELDSTPEAMIEFMTAMVLHNRQYGADDSPMGRALELLQLDRKE